MHKQPACNQPARELTSLPSGLRGGTPVQQMIATRGLSAATRQLGWRDAAISAPSLLAGIASIVRQVHV